jgi:DNA-cytosine methyltransferase
MKKINVLSLFDGISCGMVALERAEIPVNKYYASEIDKYAIKVSNKNYPNIIQLGDINNWKSWDIEWDKIDLLIGGSPCQGFSFAGKQLNFNDERSKLFFVYVDILNHIKKLNSNVKFLLENVKMKKEYLDVISQHLGIKPVFINSSLVSAQNRQRYYWTNIGNGNIEQPEDKNIYLKDILEDGFTNRHKDLCLDANYFKGGNLKNYFEKHRRQLIFSKDGLCHIADADLRGNDCIKKVYHPDGKCPTLTTIGGGHREPKILYNDGWRKLTPIECERLQTLPDNYTDEISNSQRYKCLGNGWTVDVIAHILKHMKEDL